MRERLIYFALVFNLIIGIFGVVAITRLIPTLQRFDTLFGVAYFIQFIWFLDALRKG